MKVAMEENQSKTENNPQKDEKNEEGLSKELTNEREEYFEKLRKWLDDARLWHYNFCAGLGNINPQLLNESQQPRNSIFANLPRISINHNVQNIRQRFPGNGNNFRNVRRYEININLGGNNPAANRIVPPLYQTATRQTRPLYYEFVIPPLWKRMVAELMDFLILFLVKMALTFVLLESFDIIDLEFYGFESFQKNLENPDVAMPMAMELLTLELLHRLIVCAYETYFLKGKLCATPGKRYMGLMVISIEAAAPIQGRLFETVATTGAKPLGWHKSLARAALKNVFVGLLLPLCVAFYISPHNRTSYDMMSNSIVVEYDQDFLVYHSLI